MGVNSRKLGEPPKPHIDKREPNYDGQRHFASPKECHGAGWLNEQLWKDGFKDEKQERETIEKHTAEKPKKKQK